MGAVAAYMALDVSAASYQRSPESTSACAGPWAPRGAHPRPVPRRVGPARRSRRDRRTGTRGVVTAGFAASRDWPLALPLWVLGGAAAATILLGALAGAYPAARAARMSPTAALASV
jgi:ABC-type antimicrobial peptide transport system permease subunit